MWQPRKGDRVESKSRSCECIIAGNNLCETVQDIHRVETGENHQPVIAMEIDGDMRNNHLAGNTGNPPEQEDNDDRMSVEDEELEDMARRIYEEFSKEFTEEESRLMQN